MAEPLSRSERMALGHQRRKQVAREDHATWDASARRQDPLELLQAAEAGRIPRLVELKHERMACSPFGYFRGAVPVMAYDLSLVPNTGLVTQLCGDAHVRNLGAFAGPDGRLVFDINDFDESIVGPFEWDVKRMATSLILAGREAGSKEGHCREAAATFLDRYTAMMHEFATMPVLAMAKYQVHRLKDIPAVEQILQLAQRSTPLTNLESLTEEAPKAAKHEGKHHAAGRREPSDLDPAAHPEDAGHERAGSEETDGEETDGAATGRIFKTEKPVLERMTGAAAQHVVDALGSYAGTLLVERRRFLAQYRVVDVAFKVVGTGSVGLRDYCLYLQGNGPKDPLFLQIKEEAASAYTQYVDPATQGERPAHEGQRTVEGERAMQLQSDPFLGWTTIEGRDYLVRQLNDYKASIDLADLKAAGLMEYAGVCGEILARGHARGGDCAMLAGYMGGSGRFAKAVEAFAVDYADQTDKDWKALVKSMKK